MTFLTVAENLKNRRNRTPIIFPAFHGIRTSLVFCFWKCGSNRFFNFAKSVCTQKWYRPGDLSVHLGYLHLSGYHIPLTTGEWCYVFLPSLYSVYRFLLSCHNKRPSCDYYFIIEEPFEVILQKKFHTSNRRRQDYSTKSIVNTIPVFPIHF